MANINGIKSTGDHLEENQYTTYVGAREISFNLSVKINYAGENICTQFY